MSNNDKLSTGGHLEVLRKMLFRIIIVVVVVGVIIFLNKKFTFDLILAPSRSDFSTYQYIENLLQWCGFDYHINNFFVKMISTELSSQFLVHLSCSVYLALLVSSPYIVCELFSFIRPALYSEERKYSVIITAAVFFLFFLGVFVSYYIIFPISFQFLGTYQVDPSIESTINLSSYISSFTVLTFLMGIVFQLPILTLLLVKMGIITHDILQQYRRHALFVIMAVAAFITPPDMFTMLVVTLPLYVLYEFSIFVARVANKNN